MLTACAAACTININMANTSCTERRLQMLFTGLYPPFFYILLQPCHSVLPIPPSFGETSAVRANGLIEMQLTCISFC